LLFVTQPNLTPVGENAGQNGDDVGDAGALPTEHAQASNEIGLKRKFSENFTGNEDIDDSDTDEQYNDASADFPADGIILLSSCNNVVLLVVILSLFKLKFCRTSS
jgi:hypothetical protein